MAVAVAAAFAVGRASDGQTLLVIQVLLMLLLFAAALLSRRSRGRRHALALVRLGHGASQVIAKDNGPGRLVIDQDGWRQGSVVVVVVVVTIVILCIMFAETAILFLSTAAVAPFGVVGGRRGTRAYCLACGINRPPGAESGDTPAAGRSYWAAVYRPGSCRRRRRPLPLELGRPQRQASPGAAPASSATLIRNVWKRSDLSPVWARPPRHRRRRRCRRWWLGVRSVWLLMEAAACPGSGISSAFRWRWRSRRPTFDTRLSRRAAGVASFSR